VKIRSIETLSCDAGWRNYYFVKLITEDGIVGWSEYDESFGPPGITAAIHRFAQMIVGEDGMRHDHLYARMFHDKRMVSSSVTAQAAGAIENALLDAKGKSLGVPVHALLGGKIRDRVRVYWSHCASYRISRPEVYGPPVRTLDDVKAMGEEVRNAGFTALKTNAIRYTKNGPLMYSPGFGRPFFPELNWDRDALRDLRDHLDAFRDGAGPEMDILLDINFNGRSEGMLKIMRAVADLDLFWLEMDCNNADALAYVRRQSSTSISSGETLFGLRSFLPYFQAQSMDVAIIDAIWNGVWQAMKIAAAADAHEVNVAPHNFYGHLATIMNAHFAAAVPNLRIVETDIDRIPQDKEVFSAEPVYEDGDLLVPDAPGWGIDIVEEALKAYTPGG